MSICFIDGHNRKLLFGWEPFRITINLIVTKSNLVPIQNRAYFALALFIQPSRNRTHCTKYTFRTQYYFVLRTERKCLKKKFKNKNSI